MTSRPRYDGLADWYDREIGGLEVTTTRCRRSAD
jgi:hypothetical protein